MLYPVELQVPDAAAYPSIPTEGPSRAGEVTCLVLALADDACGLPPVRPEPARDVPDADQVARVEQRAHEQIQLFTRRQVREAAAALDLRVSVVDHGCSLL